MKSFVLPFVLVASVAAAQEGERKAPTIQKVETAGAAVYFLDLPWGPQTFSMMEKGADSFYTKRTWPFARLEAKKPVTLGQTKLAAGNYALVFHPNQGEGMALEVLKIADGEFLQPGNAMTKTPQGESIHKEPASFETVAETLPALQISLDKAKDGQALVVRYGDPKLTRELKL